ncbi:hypothetical protein KEM48_002697 [Puccinia striiformis f. sp. tritici PST-130]|nr:hypothetical protein KEM48_002697 [Puccinia striiformis f. sp. tritici PST-130]
MPYHPLPQFKRLPSPPQFNPPNPQQHGNSGEIKKNRSRDSYANTYGHSAAAAGSVISSLSTIASGLVGGDYRSFPQEHSHPGGVSTSKIKLKWFVSYHPAIHLQDIQLTYSLFTIDVNFPLGSTKISSPITVNCTNHHLKSRQPPLADGNLGSVRDLLVSYEDSGLGHVCGTTSSPSPITGISTSHPA